MSGAFKVTAIGPLGQFTVRGQTAKALLRLSDAGKKGVTAQEVSSWAYRFSAYCFDLRHKHGLTIVTHKEPHEGGWHGRHELTTPVTLIDVQQPKKAA
jgi:hypothetical protein